MNSMKHVGNSLRKNLSILKKEIVFKERRERTFRMHALRFSQKSSGVKVARTSIFHPDFRLSAPNCPPKS